MENKILGKGTSIGWCLIDQEAEEQSWTKDMRRKTERNVALVLFAFSGVSSISSHSDWLLCISRRKGKLEQPFVNYRSRTTHYTWFLLQHSSISRSSTISSRRCVFLDRLPLITMTSTNTVSRKSKRDDPKRSSAPVTVVAASEQQNTKVEPMDFWHWPMSPFPLFRPSDKECFEIEWRCGILSIIGDCSQEEATGQRNHSERGEFSRGDRLQMLDCRFLCLNGWAHLKVKRRRVQWTANKNRQISRPTVWWRY